MLQRVVFLKILDDLGHVGSFLAHGHVNAVKRAEIRIAAFEAFLVDARVVDDGVDANCSLSGLAVANHQLALAASNRNHCIHCHDTGLYRLTYRFALDDSGRDFLDGITDFGGDVTLAVNRPAKRVHHASEQRLAHGHGE